MPTDDQYEPTKKEIVEFLRGVPPSSADGRPPPCAVSEQEWAIAAHALRLIRRAEQSKGKGKGRTLWQGLHFLPAEAAAAHTGGWYQVWQMRGGQPRSSDTYALAVGGRLQYFGLNMSPRAGTPAPSGPYHDWLGYEPITSNGLVRRLKGEE